MIGIIKRLVGKLFKSLEYWLGRTHVNPLYTAYINLRLLPLSQALRFPIWAYGRPYLMDLSGRVSFTCPVRTGLVRIGVVDLSPAQRGSRPELAIRGHLIFGGRALIRTNTKIYVDDKATLEIGDNLRMGAGIIINCLHHIRIEDAVRIGHRSQLLDSNMHFVLDLNRKHVAPLKKSIVIGAHSWLTNSVTLYGGGVVPPYSIVVSGSVVNKDLSALGENCILGGQPCRAIATGFRLVNNYEKEAIIDRYYRENPDGSFPVETPLREDEWFINK